MRSKVCSTGICLITCCLLLVGCGPRSKENASPAVAGASTPSAAALAAIRPGEAIARLEWLAGHWRHVEGDEVMEEHWTAPVGDSMLGVSRYVIEGRTMFHEFLRIEESDGKLIYHAMPEGTGQPTPFLQSTLEENHVAFENPAHDFPTRIEYRRRGDVLTATVSGEIRGTPRSDTWRWTLVE